MRLVKVWAGVVYHTSRSVEIFDVASALPSRPLLLHSARLNPSIRTGGKRAVNSGDGGASGNCQNRSHRDITCMFEWEIVWFYGFWGCARSFLGRNPTPKYSIIDDLPHTLLSLNFTLNVLEILLHLPTVAMYPLT
jgi:hypothetical protein